MWFYDPLAGTVELTLRFNHDSDNSDPRRPAQHHRVAVRPVILTEDGHGQQHLFGATLEGTTYPLARNEIDTDTEPSPSTASSAVPVYSADGKYLSAKVQTPGVAYAITGPWRRG